jgi:kumamolisin
MASHTILKGTALPPAAGAVSDGRADAGKTLSVTLVLHPPAGWHDHMHEGPPGPHEAGRFVGYHEFASMVGTPAQDIAAVEDWLREQRLELGPASPALHLVRASGTVAQMERAFGVELHSHRLGQHRYLHQHGEVRLPREIAALVQTVTGLDARPAAHRAQHAVGANSSGAGTAAAQPAAGPPSATFHPAQIAQLYGFPQGTGKGRRIALIQFGGGYTRPLLDAAFGKLTGGAAPSLTDACIMGAQNVMYAPNFVEVLLDIQVAGAVAPEADYLVVFAPNEFQAWVNALDAALSWQGGPPDAISISWGGPESGWPPATIAALEQVFQSAAAMGATVLTTSGDHGVTLGGTTVQVEYPAASQYALSCGGTFVARVSSAPAIEDEVVWNDSSGATGGGISQVVPPPAWQKDVVLPASRAVNGKPGRGLPDLGGNASALSGYSIMIAPDTWISGMGTSAVAPLYAGLVARLAQLRGHPLGFVNPALYANAAHANLVTEITSGNNSSNGVTGYSAGPGWNACTGLGRINGAGWEALFGTVASA